jgi:DsbC/DsbD-like thiol-disulfide interchange protein
MHRNHLKCVIAGSCFIIAAATLALPSTSVSAGGKKDESQVKFAATATKPDKDGVQTVTIKMEINNGYYAYANPVLNEDLEPTQTVVKVAGAKKSDVAYPSGKKKTDQNISYMIYEGTVEITATVTRAPGDTGPLDVTVKYAVCSVKGFCLPPEQVKLQVK